LFCEALLGGSERSDLARQDSYLFWQSQEFIGKHQATKFRPPLRMRFDKAYEVMELINGKRHVCSLRRVIPQRIMQELYAAMVLYANSWVFVREELLSVKQAAQHTRWLVFSPAD
jgi:hypothetical protein